MYTHQLLKPESRRKSSIRLDNDSRVAVMGGGPAGSFFGYFLLDLATRVGIDLKVDIYEPRDFSLPAPKGCNMCAGVISETLVQNMAMEGINLPASVVQKSINSYVLHTDLGSQRIDASYQEMRIGAMFRGAGPRTSLEHEFHGLDDYLLSLAAQKGAEIIRSRVIAVNRVEHRIQLTTRSGATAEYDLLAVASGVNTSALKMFEEGDLAYSPPQTTKTALIEYFLGKDTIEKQFGDSLHVFLLDIPRLDFGMVVPKGEFVSVCVLGKDIDDGLLQAFLAAPEVKSCFPDGWRWDQPACRCSPRINIRAPARPYADRVVFIGDSGVTRLYKDGVGAAFRSAKAAAACAVFEGITSEDFRRYYAPFCNTLERDNHFGRLIFSLTRFIQRVRFSRKAVLRMVASEQRSPSNPQRMSSVLWDTFTGSASYRDIFLRTLNPAFIGNLTLNMIRDLRENRGVGAVTAYPNAPPSS